MKLLTAIFVLSSVLSYAASPQAGAQPTPPQSANPVRQPASPVLAQHPPQPAPDSRRLEYDLNTLRSMLYQMKSDLSNVKDTAARSALLVDSQMWEWLIADKQRQLNSLRYGMPSPVVPVEPPGPRR